MKPSRRTGLALATLVTASIAGACGGQGSSTLPDPVEDSGTGSASSPATGLPKQDSGSAPQVTNPLDAGSLAEQPCAALPAPDRQRLGLTEGSAQPAKMAGTKTCSWDLVDESLNQVFLSVVTEKHGGLDSVYRNKDTNAYFEPTEIAGYPGVYSSVVDERDSGSCDLWIGIGDRTSLFIMASLEYSEAAPDACSMAADVGAATIAELGG